MMSVARTRTSRRTLVFGAGTLSAAAGTMALAGCARSDSGGSAPAGGTQAVRTLNVAANTGGGFQLEQWKPIWAAWERQYPHIKIDALTGIASTDEYRVKLVTALASGTNYDALHIHHVLSDEFMAKKDRKSVV
jgi:ABC-type glycerol-3-phosphate transport system substrate-binding protein